MLLSGRFILIFVLFFTCVSSESRKSRKSKHIYALLGYLHGYKIGYDFISKLPPVVPIIILPTVNQHQNVTILNTFFNNKNEANDVNLETLPAKVTASNSTYDKDIYNEIDSQPKESIKREVSTSIGKVNKKTEDTVRQANKAVTENKMKQNDTEVDTTIMHDVNLNNTDTNITISNTTDNTAPGMYPNAIYKNEFVNNITITTISNVEQSQAENNKDTTVHATTKGNVYQFFGTTERNKPYAAALYNNKIDEISLTTDLHVKDAQLLPSAVNNWQKFNKFMHSSGEFKPLAGLYYDGYLNTPVKRQDFVPKYWYNYYF